MKELCVILIVLAFLCAGVMVCDWFMIKDCNRTIRQLTAERDLLKAAKTIHDTIFVKDPLCDRYRQGFQAMTVQCSIAQKGWNDCLDRVRDGVWPGERMKK